ncbi:unnamed protein product [Gongylonema pulchrum]|uniref:DUF5641 domain-containing protein n=1 Tax=Gongylonema pulchrum TaxID=637853 RepID=A0A183DUW4_9BILA|nr:unnamed protein product [Gongylonema pulchrum]
MENYEMESQEPTENQEGEQGVFAVLVTASIPPAVDWERFSKWSRLKAVMQRVCHFIYRIKKQVSPSTSLAKAERWLIRGCQKNQDSTDQRWRTVGKIITQCMACKRKRARPFALPPMAPYPIERISRTRPFEHVGLDYFGPFNVRARSQVEKRWIALFTCFSTKAIHLEAVIRSHGRNLSACVSSICGLQRLPKIRIQRSWFSLYYSPCAKGGQYEMMIGLVKEALRQTVGNKLLTEQNFGTLCLEVEAVANSRQLTYTDEDPQLILRPIDFLIPHAQVSMPLPVENSCELEDLSYRGSGSDSCDKLISLCHKTAAVVDTFWDLWHRRYLNELRDREKRLQYRTSFTCPASAKERRSGPGETRRNYT